MTWLAAFMASTTGNLYGKEQNFSNVVVARLSQREMSTTWALGKLLPSTLCRCVTLSSVGDGSGAMVLSKIKRFHLDGNGFCVSDKFTIKGYYLGIMIFGLMKAIVCRNCSLMFLF